jgi:hypothetical protein
MQSILINILVMAVSRLVGSVDWNRVMAAVKTVEIMCSESTGEEKRKEAIETLRDTAESVKTWLLNLAIEIAVAKLKTLK